MARLNYSIQLKDAVSLEAIIASGGMVTVCKAGTPDKETLYNADGTSLSNPVAITNGRIEFAIGSDRNSVDLYGIAPSGHGFWAQGVKPAGPNELAIDRNQRITTIVVPWSYVDQAGDATETDTGMDLPDGLVHGIGLGLEVVAIDATETISIGLLSSGTGGDADGLMAAASIATAGAVKPTLTNGSATLGALLKVQDSANAGDAVPEAYAAGVGSNTRRLSYTLSTGADTGKGFVALPMTLLGLL